MSGSAIDVAVVGAGPAGVTLANLLGLSGLRVELFERDAAIHPLPRAIHVDGEVMRVFETAGLGAALAGIARPGVKGMHFVNAAGETLMIRAGTAGRGPHGWATSHYVHQPDLERVLRAGLGRFDTVVLHPQHEVLHVEPEGDTARLQLRDLARGIETTRHARWVVGCDGARSLLRRLLGAPLRDLGLHQPWLVFDVMLRRPMPGLPDHTVQHCNPARPMTFCNVTGRRRRWEIMLMPGDDPVQMVRPERIWPLIERWMGPDDADIERATIYTFHSVIAQGWRRGPLLLAGDAAHQTPPFLGQGLCAAIRDVANLAWKLEAVARGRAGAALLDTLESERSPHVQAFIELAVRLGGVIQTTDPAAARERDARFAAGSPEVFEFPVPRLGPGLWSGEGPPVAQVFPQPLLADGRGLDAAIGRGWALLAEPALLSAVQPATRVAWNGQAVTVREATDPAIADGLRQHGVAAVLLRPDRYVAGVARDARGLDRLCAGLFGQPPMIPPP